MSSSKSGVTPMMAQFLEIKSNYPNALLFYRMGDFYELFFDDAVAAAEALDIALTKRGKHHGTEIPMCGVPHHAAEGYLLTLIRKGFRVAVCEQLESPAEAKKRGYKAVVKRDVVRLVTPGTLTEDSLLNARRHNFLAAYSEIRGDGALAWVDISTGTFHVSPCPAVRLGPEIARLNPRELIILDGDLEKYTELETDFDVSLTPLSTASFDSKNANARLCALFSTDSLDAYGQFERAELSAMGALVDYLDITQKGKLPLLHPPKKESADKVMQIDASTRRNLEISKSLSGARDATLIATIDRTLTAAGGRLLEHRLSSPSCDLTVIEDRLNCVDHFISEPSLAQNLRDILRKSPDIDRALSRIGLERAGPRDLTAIRDGLKEAENLHQNLTGDRPPLLARVSNDLIGFSELIDLLERALIAEPPLLSRDGGFIASGYHEELDEMRTLRDEGRSVIAAMQSSYVDMTGITALKVKHNNVLGYFIETTSTHAQKMLSEPFSETFIHRQTTANAVRFTTVELSEIETKIHNAGARALEIEKALFSTLMQAILQISDHISIAAQAISEIDTATAFADIARDQNWCRPLMDDSRAFDIEKGRHPVVEAALKKDSTSPFIPNDCDLSDGSDGAHVWLLTGPNMAGKSTFLRQNALIALLAQAGSYVPASRAHIGIVKQLFSRVGASDDLARGRSTFMVEMVETAAILNQASEHALVILDEIGRGTATYDGLSIAWATLEHLHDVNKARALFATHYHEMTTLSSKLSGVENATVSVREWEGEVIFMHEVIKGAADRSYGVQVAKLAGLPASVITRAKSVLEALEKGERDGAAGKKAVIDDLPLFSATPPPISSTPKPSAMSKRIKEVFPDNLTPREALDVLYELKALSDTE